MDSFDWPDRMTLNSPILIDSIQLAAYLGSGTNTALPRGYCVRAGLCKV